jgi:5-(carboxyamino)imidazole ribonucleotide synthase
MSDGVTARLGVLGGGQLGRMMGLEGRPLGVEFRFFDPSSEAAAKQLGELFVGDFDDHEALQRLADGVDAITYEFENVPVASAESLATRVPVYPPPKALAKTQDRLIEKEFLSSLGIPVAPFRAVDDRRSLDDAVAALGLPTVLKTRTLGYDGKGQMVIRAEDDVETAWRMLHGRPLILERFVPFEKEASLVGVRGRATAAFYPLVWNTHRDGILHVTRAPGGFSPELQAEAERCLTRLFDALDYLGVCTIEFFVVDAGLVVNEVAPRVHNSGHWTIEGAMTSQFANHVRAVLGLPLGSTTPLGDSAMINVIGTLPNVDELLRLAGVYVHLYGKRPRPGRKLGHVTIAHLSPDETERRLAEVTTIIDHGRDDEPQGMGMNVR